MCICIYIHIYDDNTTTHKHIDVYNRGTHGSTIGCTVVIVLGLEPATQHIPLSYNRNMEQRFSCYYSSYIYK